jgi:hypothetical protein
MRGGFLMPTTVTVTSGKFEFVLEAFGYPSYGGDNRLRPIKVTGQLQNTKKERVPTPPALSLMAAPFKDATKRDFNQLNWNAWDTKKVDPDLGNFDRGHLIALSLGGPNQSCNIVPMYQWFNQRGPWRHLERRLKKWSKKNTLQITIEVAYSGSGDPRIPSGFRVTVTNSGQNQVTTIPHLIPPMQQIIIPNELQALFLTGEQAFKQISNYQPRIPAYKNKDTKHMYPLAGPRPYAILDFLVEQFSDQTWPGKACYCGTDYNLRSSSGVSPGHGFSDKQIVLIKFYNAWKNDGWLVSDGNAKTDPEKAHGPPDQKTQLNEYGDNDSPEVDHIIPESVGGSNLYSNARVVSQECNLGKGTRVKPYEHLLSPKAYADWLKKKAQEEAEEKLLKAKAAAMTNGDDEAKAVATIPNAPNIQYFQRFVRQGMESASSSSSTPAQTPAANMIPEKKDVGGKTFSPHPALGSGLSSSMETDEANNNMEDS